MIIIQQRKGCRANSVSIAAEPLQATPQWKSVVETVDLSGLSALERTKKVLVFTSVSTATPVGNPQTLARLAGPRNTSHWPLVSVWVWGASLRISVFWWASPAPRCERSSGSAQQERNTSQRDQSMPLVLRSSDRWNTSLVCGKTR